MMQKQKRKRSNSGSNNATTTSHRRRRSSSASIVYESENPFLQLVTAPRSNSTTKSPVFVSAENVNNKNELFPLVASFLELSKKKQQKGSIHNDNDHEEQTAEQTSNEHSDLPSVVDKLLSMVLEFNNNNVCSSSNNQGDEQRWKGQGLVTVNDVITMLLPWAIKRIVQTPIIQQCDLTLEWKTISISMDYLFGRSFSNDKLASDSESITSNVQVVVNKVLSLSVLHKLVPRAASVAFQGLTSISEMASTAYSTLLNKCYRPPFDAVCDTLLPIIGEQAVQQLDNGETNLIENYCYPSMTIATLNLLQTTLPKANPKKAFQLLLRPKTLAAISDIHHVASMHVNETESISSPHQDIQALIQTILHHGIFSLEHHMDGFRSMTNLELPDLTSPVTTDKNVGVKTKNPSEALSPSFRFYQQELLSVVSSTLDLSNLFSGSLGTVMAAQSIVRAIPLLFDGFIRATHDLLSDMRSSDTTAGAKKKAAVVSRKITHLQFLIFANLTGPMMQWMNGRCSHIKSESANETFKNNDHFLQVVMVDSIGKCMDLVLTRDVYIPSNTQDMGAKQFQHLQTMVNILVQQTTSASSSIYPARTTGRAMSSYQGILSILSTVIRLNHLLIHEQLVPILQSSMTVITDQCEGSVFGEARLFFRTVISVYKQLRQLDYLCRSLITVATSLCKKNAIQQLNTLLLLSQDQQVHLDFCNAVQTSPIYQIKEILSECNGWISTEVPQMRKAATNDKANQASVSFVVYLFSLLLENIRIDAASALDLTPLCHDIVEGSIHSLIGSQSALANVDIYARRGIRLCGWTIDFKNRCDFWTRTSQEEETKDEFDIPFAVTNILEEAVELVGKSSTKWGEEMNSQILDDLQFLACHRIQQLHARVHEQQRIAFALDGDEYNCQAEMAETKMVSLFALKALNDDHQRIGDIKGRWLLLAETIASWARYAEVEDMRRFLSHLFSCVIELNNDNDTPAMQLLQDANFLEYPNVLENLGSTGLSYSFKCLQKALACISTTKGDAALNLACPIHEPGWTKLKATDFDRLSKMLHQMQLKELTSNETGEARQNFSNAIRCLRLLNSIPCTTWKHCEEIVEIYESCVRMSIVAMTIADLTGPSQFDAIELVVVIRQTLSKFLTDSGANLKDTFWSQKLLKMLFKPTLSLLNSNTFPESVQQQVIESTKALLGNLISYWRDKGVLSEIIDSIEQEFPSHALNTEDSSFALLSACGSSIIAVLSKNVHEDKGLLDKIVRVIKNSLLSGAIQLIVKGGPCDTMTRHYVTILVAEMLQSSMLSAEEFPVPLNRIENDLVAKVESDVSHGTRNSNVQLTPFLVAGLVRTEMSSESKEALCGILLKAVPNSSPLLENALCELLISMDQEQLRACLHALTSFDFTSRQATSRLRLMRLLVLNVKTQDQLNLVSTFAAQFLMHALNAMLGGGISVAVPLIVDMASSKDLISIRERDLSLILAYIGSALHSHCTSSCDKCEAVNEEAFNPSITLMSFLLQRFPKQLYSCVPSVITTLRVLFGHSLYGELDDLQIVSRGHQLTRICELLLPHKEVYKKHVLCLVVEFVQALGKDLDPIRRTSLSPAVYCLLDMLQQHETSQLNSMLDDMGRALLKTIHENYKKQFVYRGQ